MGEFGDFTPYSERKPRPKNGRVKPHDLFKELSDVTGFYQKDVEVVIRSLPIVFGRLLKKYPDKKVWLPGLGDFRLDTGKAGLRYHLRKGKVVPFVYEPKLKFQMQYNGFEKIFGKPAYDKEQIKKDFELHGENLEYDEKEVDYGDE